MKFNFNGFKNQLATPFAFRMFLLIKLPAAFFAGIRLRELTEGKAVVSVRYSWYNKNPFRSLYFAVLSMAAEASTGIMCMSALRIRKTAVSMLIVKIEGNFYKKAVGVIHFTCLDGLKIQQAVNDAITSGESKSVTCQSIGRNEPGETVAEFFCVWSFKVRSTV